MSNYYIPDILDAVVADARKTASITGITDNGDGTYTVATTNTYELAAKEFITISGTTNFNGSYKISNVVEDTSFDITKTAGVASETGTWTADYPYFVYGHKVDVIRDLEHKQLKNKKYPLIIVPWDVPEDKNVYDVYSRIKIDVVICTLTDKEYTSAERYTQSYKTVLQPLYNDFIAAIKDSDYFKDFPNNKPPHQKTDRLYWGRKQVNELLQTNDKRVLTDCVDAIEVSDLELDIRENINSNCL